jgi:hypothetical protein
MAHEIANALNPECGFKNLGSAVTNDRRNLIL